MATLPKPPPAAVSLEEFLSMSFDGPDAEYVDGAIVERSMPSRPHARAQIVLAKVFGQLETVHNLDPYTELRLRLGPARVRVPDFCVFRSPVYDDAPDFPPMLVVEIVSPSDIHSALMQKLAEYGAWGVEHVWLVDPGLRRLAVYRDEGLLNVPELTLPEFDVRLTVEDLFDR